MKPAFKNIIDLLTKTKNPLDFHKKYEAYKVFEFQK